MLGEDIVVKFSNSSQLMFYLIVATPEYGKAGKKKENTLRVKHPAWELSFFQEALNVALVGGALSQRNK